MVIITRSYPEVLPGLITKDKPDSWDFLNQFYERP